MSENTAKDIGWYYFLAASDLNEANGFHIDFTISLQHSCPIAAAAVMLHLLLHRGGKKDSLHFYAPTRHTFSDFSTAVGILKESKVKIHCRTVYTVFL